MRKAFIITTNRESAEALLQEGLELIVKDSNMWTFANDGFEIKGSGLRNVSYSDKINL